MAREVEWKRKLLLRKASKGIPSEARGGGSKIQCKSYLDRSGNSILCAGR